MKYIVFFLGHFPFVSDGQVFDDGRLVFEFDATQMAAPVLAVAGHFPMYFVPKVCQQVGPDFRNTHHVVRVDHATTGNLADREGVHFEDGILIGCQQLKQTDQKKVYPEV